MQSDVTARDLAEGVAAVAVFALSRAGVFAAVRRHTNAVDDAVGALAERLVA